MTRQKNISDYIQDTTNLSKNERTTHEELAEIMEQDIGRSKTC